MTKNNQQSPSELTKLILGRKGGKTTIKILDKLLTRPYNINQLANDLNVNYNTVRYHMIKIDEHKYVIKEKDNYGKLYSASPKLKKSLKELEQIKKYLNLK